MKVLMLPRAGKGSDGISRVIEAYHRLLPQYGVELVGEEAASYDLKAVHVESQDADVLHNHGLYWTADGDYDDVYYRINAKIIQAARRAREITVPSSWVAETFQRDMRIRPHVVPHGVDWDGWQHDEPDEGYVLWNKNRPTDVCDTGALDHLAGKFTEAKFMTTFAGRQSPNVKVIGTVPHEEMRRIVQRCSIYLATTKETFGIGVLEAMAAGKPVLGFAHGGVLDLVRHGVNGYLAAPGNMEDLVDGLAYCWEHAAVLGENGRELARAWTWEAACEQVAAVYRSALREEPPTVAVVIPSFMYAELVGRAVESAIRQTCPMLAKVIVIDDGSDDDGATERVIRSIAEKDGRVEYLRQENQGVAVARNAGIRHVSAKYVCCLDADDEIAPTFLEKCVAALEADRSLGVAYTGLLLRLPDGREVRSPWPKQCDFDQHLRGNNQVPTCAVFRREAWERLGGYRQRYAPLGCGTEDAEFWLRVGACGWGIRQVTEEPLFVYTMGGRTMSTPDYKEVDWRVWHPYTRDLKHPFASIAAPRRLSHPVRQYDEPTVSVVIPVGPGHERDVVNALDSLEAQTFRRWEAIVYWDSDSRGSGSPQDDVSVGYPYVKMVSGHDWPKGAGHARNRGAKIARAPFLLFLDADDWLFPEALEEMMLAMWDNDHQAAVYSDHIRLAYIDQKLARKEKSSGKLIEYNADGHAVIRAHSKEYDPVEAMRQPDLEHPYIWNLITTLIPTEWHREIGGFDEKMWSWEDWDYWIRLARRGKNFVRVAEPLVVYRYYSGNRREDGKEIAGEMAAYMKEKYDLT